MGSEKRRSRDTGSGTTRRELRELHDTGENKDPETCTTRDGSYRGGGTDRERGRWDDRTSDCEDFE